MCGRDARLVLGQGQVAAAALEGPPPPRAPEAVAARPGTRARDHRGITKTPRPSSACSRVPPPAPPPPSHPTQHSRALVSAPCFCVSPSQSESVRVSPSQSESSEQSVSPGRGEGICRIAAEANVGRGVVGEQHARVVLIHLRQPRYRQRQRQRQRHRHRHRRGRRQRQRHRRRQRQRLLLSELQPRERLCIHGCREECDRDARES